MNTMQLLDQDQVWCAAGSILIKLTEMDAHHRSATLAMLRRRAEYQHKMYHLAEERMFLDAPDDVYDEWFRRSSMSLRDDPAAWLERRPLVMELARLVREDESVIVDGEVVPEKLEITDGPKCVGRSDQ